MQWDGIIIRLFANRESIASPKQVEMENIHLKEWGFQTEKCEEA